MQQLPSTRCSFTIIVKNIIDLDPRYLILFRYTSDFLPYMND